MIDIIRSVHRYTDNRELAEATFTSIRMIEDKLGLAKKAILSAIKPPKKKSGQIIFPAGTLTGEQLIKENHIAQVLKEVAATQERSNKYPEVIFIPTFKATTGGQLDLTYDNGSVYINFKKKDRLSNIWYISIVIFDFSL